MSLWNCRALRNGSQAARNQFWKGRSMETTDTVQVSRAALNEMEVRSLSINAKIHGLIRLLDAGQVDRAKSLAWLLQELNCKQSHGLVAAGAVDSAAAAVGGYSTVWDDDEPGVDAERLDLGELG